MENAPVVNVKEAAEMLHLSPGSAWRAIHSGEIPCLKIGGRYLVPRQAILRMVAEAGDKVAAGDAEASNHNG